MLPNPNKSSSGRGNTNLARLQMFALALLLLAACQQQPEPARPESKAAKGLPPQGIAPVRKMPPRLRLDIAERLQAAKQNPYPGKWQLAGPYNGGRITDLEMPPSDTCVIYAGAASGGVFKSCDCGGSWTPIFDQMPTLSIGDLATDPQNSQTIYAGTGEINAGGGSFTYDGLGIFKSTDGGKTWEHAGLEASGGIGRIAVHPLHSDTIYAAAMGSLFANNKERGVYRSANGGKSWENVLHLSDSTGCADVILHGRQPQTVFAVMWERSRNAQRKNYGGPTSGIYRSVNGGSNWERLHHGLPTRTDIGRIALAAAPGQPELLYATFADTEGLFIGIYKSKDGGKQWEKTASQPPAQIWDDYGWWFGKIWVSPQSPQRVLVAGIELYETNNGGETWSMASSPDMHVDYHALCFNPLNSHEIFAGNDGGVYRSTDGGHNWKKAAGLPIAQIYECCTHPLYANRIYCGTQDNGVLHTKNPGQAIWESLVEGDCFGIHISPRNPSKMLVLREYGKLLRSPDGGKSFLAGTSDFGPCNWNAPLLPDPCDDLSLYLGAGKLWRSQDAGGTWQPMSPDLGGVHSNPGFGTITAIAVSPANCKTIYAGTDSGLLWKSKDAGNKWERIDEGLPKKWVSALAAHPQKWETVYVGFSGYREGEQQAYLYQSDNAGKKWASISGNMPPVAVNDILLPPNRPGLCIAATDGGVFISQNGTAEWQHLGSGLPPAPVTDLEYHPAARQLHAATYGRSLYKMEFE